MGCSNQWTQPVGGPSSSSDACQPSAVSAAAAAAAAGGTRRHRSTLACAHPRHIKGAVDLEMRGRAPAAAAPLPPALHAVRRSRRRRRCCSCCCCGSVAVAADAQLQRVEERVQQLQAVARDGRSGKHGDAHPGPSHRHAAAVHGGGKSHRLRLAGHQRREGSGVTGRAAALLHRPGQQRPAGAGGGAAAAETGQGGAAAFHACTPACNLDHWLAASHHPGGTPGGPQGVPTHRSSSAAAAAAASLARSALVRTAARGMPRASVTARCSRVAHDTPAGSGQAASRRSVRRGSREARGPHGVRQGGGALRALQGLVPPVPCPDKAAPPCQPAAPCPAHLRRPTRRAARSPAASTSAPAAPSWQTARAPPSRSSAGSVRRSPPPRPAAPTTGPGS